MKENVNLLNQMFEINVKDPDALKINVKDSDVNRKSTEMSQEKK